MPSELAPSTYRLVWSPLPPQRDGSRSSSTSGPSQQQPSLGRRLKLNLKAQQQQQRVACAQLPLKVEAPSPRSSITLLIRGFASLLQLLPQFLYRVFFQISIPYITFSVAASLLCFLSLNIPGTYLMLCAVLGLVAFTILSISACATGPNSFAPVPVPVPANDVPAPPPPLPPHFSSGNAVPLRRRHTVSELPLNSKQKPSSARAPTSPTADGSSSSSNANLPSPSGLSLRQRRLLRRQQTAARISNLGTVPEALAAEHPAPLLPSLSRPASLTFLSSPGASSTSPLDHALAPATPGGALPDLLTLDGTPVTDIQLAACVSHLGAGLDHTTTTTASTCTLETPFAMTVSGDSFGGGGGLEQRSPVGSAGGSLQGGGITSVCRVDSADSTTSSAAAAAAKTMLGRAYEMGERVWPWVTVPVAVACLPVAVVCTLPVAVPLLCTYGAVRLGVSVVRAGAAVVCDYVPGAKTAP